MRLELGNGLEMLEVRRVCEGTRRRPVRTRNFGLQPVGNWALLLIPKWHQGLEEYGPCLI